MGVVANLIVRIGADVGALDKVFTDLERGAGQLQKTYEQLGAKLQGIGSKLTAGLTVPIVGFGVAAAKSFIDFESAMKGVQAALTPTGTELATLEAAALEWGAKTKFSATEAATALGELGKAGFSSSESIKGLPSVLQLATVSGMSLADTATLTADTLKQFNLGVGEAGRVNDVLAKAAQTSTVDVAQLGLSLKYVGPVAAGLGLSFEQTNAALAAFGNVGVKADTAGIALKNTLGAVVNTTKPMRDVLGELGITTLASADGSVRLADVLDRLTAAGATTGQVLKAFGEQAGPGMIALVKQGSGPLRELEAQMGGAAGTAQKAADVIMSGFGGALENMRGSIETAGIAIGKVLAPALTAAAEAIGRLASFVTGTIVPAFTAIPKPIQLCVGAVLAIAAAAGPVIYIAGTLISAWGAVAGAFAVGSTGAGVLSGALAVITGPIGLVVAAVAGLVIGLRWLTGSWEGVLRVFSLGLLDFGRVAAIWDLLKAGAAALMDGLAYLGDLVGGALLSAWSSFRGILEAVADSGFGRLVRAVAGFIATAAGWAIVTQAQVTWTALKGAVWLVGQAFEFVWGILKPIAAFIGSILGPVVSYLWDTFVKGAAILAGQVVAGFRVVVEWLDKLAGRAADVITWLGKTIPGFNTVAASAEAAGAKLAAFGGVVFASGTQAGAAAGPTAALAGQVATVGPAAAAAGPPVARLATVSKEAAAAAKAAAKALSDLTDELSGTKAIAEAEQYLKALKALPAGATLTVDAMKKVHGVLDDALAAYHALGKQVPAAMEKVWLATMAPAEVKSDIRAFVALFKDSLEKVPPFLAALTTKVRVTLQALPWPLFGKGLDAHFKSPALLLAVDKWGAQFTAQVGDILANMLTGQTGFKDGLVAMLRAGQSFATDVLKDVGRSFMAEIQKGMKDGADIDWGGMFGGDEKTKGAIAGAAVGSAVGIAFGQAFGKVAGALAGAASGAATGALIGGWAGAAVGLAVGALSGWLSGMQKESQQRDAMAEARNELQATFGTLGDLEEAAHAAGVDFDLLWRTDDPKVFNAQLQSLRMNMAAGAAEIKDLAAAMDRATAQGTLLSRIDLSRLAVDTGRMGTSPAIPGAEAAAGAFIGAQQTAALQGIDTFLQHATIRTAAGAAAISASLAGVYQTMLEGGMAPTAAFAAMEPTIARLQAQLAATGFAGTAAFTPLADLARLSADAIAGPVFDAMAGLAQGLTSTANLGLLNQTTFGGFADELLASYNLLEQNNEGGVVAMQGMHGALQKVWELSQDFGYELTAEQQTLIDVAKAGGVIGDQFRPATDRMANAIDKLVERLDKFLLTMNQIGPDSKSQSTIITDAFGNIYIPPVTVPFEYRYPDNGPPGYTPPAPPPGAAGHGPASPGTPPGLAGGGIVTRPTIALIGEAGPEAVVPLRRSGFDTTTEAAIYLDGDVLTRAVLKRQGRVLRSYGGVR
jgi:TP901 family phage tail tape measure protein